MEIMIHWFWLVQLIIASVIITVSYIAFVKKKFDSKFWNILALILIILVIIQPIKLEPETNKQHKYMNKIIEQRNNTELPEMKKDNYFKEKASSINGISEDDLK
jgi:hypothetical protein